MQESFWWWQCSSKYIVSLFPKLLGSRSTLTGTLWRQLGVKQDKENNKLTPEFLVPNKPYEVSMDVNDHKSNQSDSCINPFTATMSLENDQ